MSINITTAGGSGAVYVNATNDGTTLSFTASTPATTNLTVSGGVGPPGTSNASIVGGTGITATATGGNVQLDLTANLTLLTDVSASSPSTGEVLGWTGSAWEPVTAANTTGLASVNYVDGVIQNLVGTSPATLDTLSELAAAISDDANFATSIATSIAGKANLSHSHEISDVNGLNAALAAKGDVNSLSNVAVSGEYTDLLNIPTTFQPAGHTHGITDVTGLQTALDAKATNATLATVAFSGNYSDLTGTPTTQAVANVTGLQDALDDKADANHTHNIADITGLQGTLDNLSSFSGNYADLTGIPTTFQPSNHTHTRENITDLTTSDLDLQGNKVLFANVYSTEANLPNATTYHGMFAHVHDYNGTGGAAVYAHGGNWTQLLDASDVTTLNGLSGNVSLVAGNNVVITSSNNSITVAAEDSVGWTFPAPTEISSTGDLGAISYDNDWFYVRTVEGWKRTALSSFSVTIEITTQPASVQIQSGDSTQLSVVATAQGFALSYQWQESQDEGETWSNISGGTGSLQTVSPSVRSHYRVIVSSGDSSETSQVAIVSLQGDTSGGTSSLFLPQAPTSYHYEYAIRAPEDGNYGNFDESLGYNATQNPSIVLPDFANSSVGSVSSYQWQISFDSGTTWGSIPGATNSSTPMLSGGATGNKYTFPTVTSGNSYIDNNDPSSTSYTYNYPAYRCKVVIGSETHYTPPTTVAFHHSESVPVPQAGQYNSEFDNGRSYYCLNSSGSLTVPELYMRPTDLNFINDNLELLSGSWFYTAWELSLDGGITWTIQAARADSTIGNYGGSSYQWPYTPQTTLTLDRGVTSYYVRARYGQYLPAFYSKPARVFAPALITPAAPFVTSEGKLRPTDPHDYGFPISQRISWQRSDNSGLTWQGAGAANQTTYELSNSPGASGTMYRYYWITGLTLDRISNYSNVFTIV